MACWVAVLGEKGRIKRTCRPPHQSWFVPDTVVPAIDQIKNRAQAPDCIQGARRLNGRSLRKLNNGAPL